MFGRWLILAAAGSGARSGEAVNKAFAPLGDTCPALMCLEAFAPFVDGAVVAIGADDARLWESIKDRLPGSLPAAMVQGGATRQASVSLALERLPQDASLVAVHDAARPFVSPRLIARCFEEAGRSGCAVPAISVADTTLSVDVSGRVDPLRREDLRAVQTPQVFRRDWLAKAHKTAMDASATDDASLVRAAGFPVSIVDGDASNRKLTTPADFRLARLEMESVRMPRVGFGLDAHRLTSDRPLILCGVNVPHTMGLLGHSDADVAAHALIDALLGAAALGDIGGWFPDTDEAYRGISSMLLLKRVAGDLKERGWAIGSVDVTIVAQRPKLAGYIPQMRQSLAETLGISADRASVKATTTERMGYEGREEGITARAVAVIYGGTTA
ncbi:MAG: 2-C-methyl-D-erythritol 2,4-cyclodiphosphate synthase [Oscillospiraceae bacterium]|jgi:2-C-methyl-D-erythritol 4-phosphate cytidylyltransferase/2-C-methyl-D-erythritol 2,4-cyclodiphosphate synthase|nr:2-C-methyl-D-erythritol 2,4-cyclodiphosphate synthase [Oscillospiraceae bacterium]